MGDLAACRSRWVDMVAFPLLRLKRGRKICLTSGATVQSNENEKKRKDAERLDEFYHDCLQHVKDKLHFSSPLPTP